MGFHKFPAGVAVGDLFLCAPIVSFDEVLRAIVVEVSHPDSFKRQAAQDPNVRYVEESGIGAPTQ